MLLPSLYMATLERGVPGRGSVLHAELSCLCGASCPCAHLDYLPEPASRLAGRLVHYHPAGLHVQPVYLCGPATCPPVRPRHSPACTSIPLALFACLRAGRLARHHALPHHALPFSSPHTCLRLPACTPCAHPACLPALRRCCAHAPLQLLAYKCWRKDPKLRPSFADITAHLTTMMRNSSWAAASDSKDDMDAHLAHIARAMDAHGLQGCAPVGSRGASGEGGAEEGAEEVQQGHT